MAASAFGVMVLPLLADGTVPDSLKAPPITQPSPVQQKLQDGLCPLGGLQYSRT